MDHSIVDFFGSRGSVNTLSQNRLRETGSAEEPQVALNRDKEGIITQWGNDLTLREITMTFRDRLLNIYQYPYLQHDISCYLNKPSNTKIVDFILVNDYSDGGRYHLHGIFRVKRIDLFGKLITRLSRKYGRIENKSISFFNSYLDYMFKIYDRCRGEYRLQYSPSVYISNVF